MWFETVCFVIESMTEMSLQAIFYDDEIIEHLKDFLFHAFLFRALAVIWEKQNNCI